MLPFAEAVDVEIGKQFRDALAQMEGVPEDDLNEWKPAQGLEDINTFFALATHLVSATEYWILHAAGGQPTNRDRPAEFYARGSFDDLKVRYDRCQRDCRAVLEAMAEADLARVWERGGDDPRRHTIAECLVHSVVHSGVHVGHLQIQRQLWNAERGNAS